MAITTDPQALENPPASPPSDWALLSFFVALGVLAGSLYMTLGMGLIACPLCLFQRTFVIGIVGVLGVGLLAKVKPVGSLALLSLPLAAGGCGVAVLHVYLENAGKLECPTGLAGIGSAPQQALAAQALLLLLLVADALRTRGLLPVVGALVLGAVFAVALIRTGPPPPKVPPGGWPDPLKGCRPPYRPEG
jgi:disulfide bond formation protein DsbB